MSIKKQYIVGGLIVVGIAIIVNSNKAKPAQPVGDNGIKNADDDYSNFLGMFKKKSKSTSRQLGTRCATNLERLASLYPNQDQYNAELGKVYQQQGSNFMNWANTQAKPCFVIGGVEQGGLQSGGISFDGTDNVYGAGQFD